MCKTKIVATLGPASQSETMIRKLIQAGVNVVRLNFSHGTAQEHIAKAALVRSISRSLNQHVGVLVDLQGPKIRISCFKTGVVELEKGQTFCLDASLDVNEGTKECVGLDYPQLIEDLEVGNTLLLDDGRIQLEVTEVDKELQKVKTVVLNSGKLSNRKGINLLGGGLSAPALTEKDLSDISIASALNADFLAISFPRNAEDIHYARRKALEAGCNAQIVAKIERAEVVENEQSIDEMVKAADVIMVARGDLGVEIGDARLPFVQKQIIARSRHFGKPVITATQMMESMIENPLPTRAEVLDVANAVMDGTDAVMLSAESAAGDYPVEAVEAMVRIATGAEEQAPSEKKCWDCLQHLCTEPEKRFALSSMISAVQENSDFGVAIVTEQGNTPLIMSRCQSKSMIWALSDKPALLRQLSILRGVKPVYFEHTQCDSEQLSVEIIKHLLPDAQRCNVKNMVITQCESLEGVGDINVCRLVTLESKTVSEEKVPA